MIWALYLMLGVNMWWDEYEKVDFDDDAWEKIVEEVKASGLNTIVLDLAEGVQYKSHPEIAHPGAWSTDRVRAEVKRLREMGITLIPKMNFSATHHLWLGKYRKMMSTDIYYDVCKDLIKEVYELFDHPEYIHLGMDEEGNTRILRYEQNFVSFRRGELLFHDLKFLCDCVKETGAKPWIWSDNYNDHTEEFKKYIDTENILLSPWYYHAIKKEHFRKISDMQMYVDFYSQPLFKDLDITYVEEDPALAFSRNHTISVTEDGYDVVPTASTFNKNEYNADDLVDHYKTNAKKERVKGFMTAPWVHTTNENVEEIIKGIRLLADAKNKYYKGE